MRRSDGTFSANRTHSQGQLEDQAGGAGDGHSRKAGSQPPQLELQGNSNELIEMANKIDDVSVLTMSLKLLIIGCSVFWI